MRQSCCPMMLIKISDNPERMFHIGRKVVNYWDISEDLGYVILSVNLDELESVLSCRKRVQSISCERRSDRRGRRYKDAWPAREGFG